MGRQSISGQGLRRAGMYQRASRRTVRRGAVRQVGQGVLAAGVRQRQGGLRLARLLACSELRRLVGLHQQAHRRVDSRNGDELRDGQLSLHVPLPSGLLGRRAPDQLVEQLRTDPPVIGIGAGGAEHNDRYPGDWREECTYLDYKYKCNTTVENENYRGKQYYIYPYTKENYPDQSTSKYEYLPYLRKWVDPTFTAGNANVNFIVYRYADLLLTLAEAANELGGAHTREAVGYVNDLN